MSGGVGTPLWLTLLLQALTIFISVCGTHILAKNREKTKTRDDVVKEWRKDQLAQLRECSELARRHYLDPASIPATQLSASKILDELKRFRAKLFDVNCINGSDAKEASILYQEFHGLITGAEEFQSGGRAVLDMADSLFQKIRDCEESLARNLKKDRSAKA